MKLLTNDELITFFNQILLNFIFLVFSIHKIIKGRLLVQPVLAEY